MSGKKTRLIDTQDAFNVLSDYYHHNSATQHLALQEALNKVPTVDAVPLDGSFLKMSRGDYLIYKRHWLYEHFDQEIDIQRSAMKSMGYEPALKDTEPRWIPCSERLPAENGTYLVYAPEYRGGSSRGKEYHDGIMFAIFKAGKWSIEHGYYSRPNCVIAWMPLPEPYEGDNE